jgi:hypothetical protein
MTDLLAIISKAVFEEDAKGARVGQVLPIDRYNSAHKALAPLADGGRLFLVTVRPPDERLWLVAVLDGPKQKRGAWVAAPNKVPITDLGPVKSRIQFASGGGISAKKGALGMSLQTPRRLADGAGALLLGASPSAPPTPPTPQAVEPPPPPAAPPPLPAAGPEPTLRERIDWIVEHGTVAHFFDEEAVDKACSEAHAATLGERVRAIDPVKLLQRQLQGGVLDELRWPAQEEAAALLGEDVNDLKIGGPFPHLVLRSAKDDRIVVVGPDGIVLDRPLKLAGKEISSVQFIDGDVLVIYSVSDRYQAIWLSVGEPFKAKPISSRVEVAGVGGFNGHEGVPALRRTKTTMKMMEGQWHMLFGEGGRWFRTKSHYAHVEFDADGRAKKEDRFQEFDPLTGKGIAIGLPPWFAARMTKGAHLNAEGSFLYPVPARAERSPLGARNGLGALIVRREADGTIYAEGADGRSWRGRVTPPERGDHKTGLPRALMRFPEREGTYPIVFADDDRWSKVLMPDGRTVLVHARWEHFWAGVPQIAWSPAHPAHHWLHLYQPRDPAASRALRDTSEETARALLAAADAIFAVDADLEVPSEIAPMLRPLARWPELAKKIRTMFAGFDDRLIAGLASIAMQAASAHARLQLYKTRLDELAETANEPPETTPWSDDSTRAWQEVFPSIRFGDRVEGQDLRKQLRWIDRLLFDDGAPPDGLRSGPPSLVWWEPLFLHQGGLLFRLFAVGTPMWVRQQLRALLGMWATTSLAARCEELRYLGVQQGKGVLAGADTRRPTFLHERNRYVYRMKCVTSGAGTLSDYAYYVVERAPDGVFVDPPQGKILFDERPQRFWHGKERLDEALRLYDERGPMTELDAQLVARLAEGTGLGRVAAALVWLGAIQPWDENVPKQLRKMIGAKVDELERAQTELEGIDLHQLYARAMPERLSDLFTSVESLIGAWNQLHGKQPPLQTERVEQIEQELRGAPVAAVHAIRVLEDPAPWDYLVKDARWVVRPYRAFASNVSYRRGYIPAGWPKPESMGEEEEVNGARLFDGRVLRYYLRYVPWAYQDLPVGDPMRENVAKLAARVAERLANPELLLLAGAIDLSLKADPKPAFHELVDRFRAPPYRAVDGGAAAPGFDRGDLVVTWPSEDENGAFFAFRPSRVRDARAIEQLAGDLGVADLFRRKRRGCACGLNLGSYDVVDLTDLSPWLAWIAPGFQALVRELQHPEVAAGRFVSDPRACRPALVEEARARHDLSEDAATLWLQILTLADPTPARLQRINGWERARHDRAGEALLARGLVIEGKHPRTPRTLFAPGPIVVPKAPAAAIEAHKAVLYDVDAALAPVFGVVLPLSPLGELFDEEWAAAR